MLIFKRKYYTHRHTHNKTKNKSLLCVRISMKITWLQNECKIATETHAHTKNRKLLFNSKQIQTKKDD